MDFSYLDKKEYSGISLLDESMMNPASPDTEQFFIRKYRVNSDARLHRHTYIQINYVCRGRGHHIVNNRKTEISSFIYRSKRQQKPIYVKNISA